MIRILLLLLLATGHMFSQTISGRVYDENKKPMQGVSVYLDGTTIGTSTDETGKYDLSIRNTVNTMLVIRFIGYETMIIENPFKDNNAVIYMTPKATSLDEIVIAKDPFTREQKLAVFREQFLGKTKAGKTCKILNENEIDFEYDYKTNTLIASSNVPLEIENLYLGYRIEFEMLDFYVKFYKKSIKSADVMSSLFLGTTRYADANISEKTDKNRGVAYFGSQMHFFKNLSQNVWGGKNFLLFNGSYQDNPDHFFSITQEGSLKKITVTKNTQTNGYIANTGSKFIATFNLLYNKKKQSKVDFLIQEFYVDEFGNSTEADKIQFGGDLGKKRLGDMLPMDFVPKN
ncbi:carboxypeptidase-like regulatory domain-containing protein [Flavobacterium enshiense]|uniref:carboxypeptidase-like regulatory domain-containing protein n=1 Tax=Flavobacterium enshiense TaxID=1341165 RepID=UPI00345C848B